MYTEWLNIIVYPGSLDVKLFWGLLRLRITLDSWLHDIISSNLVLLSFVGSHCRLGDQVVLHNQKLFLFVGHFYSLMGGCRPSGTHM